MTQRVLNEGDAPILMDMRMALAGFPVDPSKSITDQESRGQNSLVNSDQLPIKFNHHPNGERVLEALGFVWGDKAVGDELFRDVTMPKGWKKVATDHDMWSDVVDDQGRKRLSIFYKAAFYDRDAFTNIHNRYHMDSKLYMDRHGLKEYNYDIKRPNDLFEADCVVDSATGKDIFRTDIIVRSVGVKGSDENEKARLLWIKQSDENETVVKQWMKDNKPEWENPLMYWDD